MTNRKLILNSCKGYQSASLTGTTTDLAYDLNFLKKKNMAPTVTC